MPLSTHPRCDLFPECPPEECPPPCDFGKCDLETLGAEKCFVLGECDQKLCDEDPRDEDPRDADPWWDWDKNEDPRSEGMRAADTCDEEREEKFEEKLGAFPRLAVSVREGSGLRAVPEFANPL